MSNEDSAIINAEKKMGINRFANPYFVQVILLGFVLGPVILGGIVAKGIATASPEVNSSQTGWIVTGLLWAGILAFGLKTFQTANSSKWFELSYCGSEGDLDWTSSFRMDPIVAIDLGEAAPLILNEKEQGIPAASLLGQQPNSSLKEKMDGVQKPRPRWASSWLPKPKQASPKGHCWQVILMDKNLPTFLVWLPAGYDFETCCNFKGHTVQAFFRGFPFNIKDGTRATFLRTSWTQDPDGTIIPIGVFTHYDLRTKLLRREIEPLEAPGAEVQGLAIVRDNFHRQELALELQSTKKERDRLQNFIDRQEDASYEKAGALFLAAKGRHKKEPEKNALVGTRRRQIIILIVAFAIFGLAITGIVSGGKLP